MFVSSGVKLGECGRGGRIGSESDGGTMFERHESRLPVLREIRDGFVEVDSDDVAHLEELRRDAFDLCIEETDYNADEFVSRER